MTPERKDWFLTRSGRKMFALEPNPADILIEDIAHGLSNICRWGGQCATFYSVAQHSVHVAQLVQEKCAGYVGDAGGLRARKVALAGLLHDATEAYLGDVVRPIKALLSEYHEIESRWWRAIAFRFGLNLELPQAVHDADLVALATERRDLMPWAHVNLRERSVQPDPERIVPWAPRVARGEFRCLFEELSS